MFLRTFKYAAFVIGSGALLGSGYSNNWDFSNIGLIRFGRATFTIGSIALDYKLSLKNYTDNSDESLKMWSTVHERSAQKLLNLCCTNGGVFIKVGQHIATLEYIIPREYCKTLSVLHSKGPKTNITQIKKVIKEDLKQDPEELFVNFSEKPLGTASLAQVHKATLKNGQVVAVKVQHPEAKRHSLIDIAIMDLLVHAIAKLFPEFSFLWLAEETKINLPLELDFIHEGHNAEKISQLLSHLNWLKIPKIFWELSSPRVLTMEFIDGGEVTDRKYLANNNINVRTISELLGLLYSEMIFVQGYVHCDPHPGNIFVKKNKDQIQIILLDHGLYTTLSEEFRHNYSQFWLSILNSDINGIKEWGKKLGVKDLAPLLACLLTSRTWDTIVTGLYKEQSLEYKKAESEKVKKYVQKYFPEISQVLSRVKREMLLLFKTNDLLRGIETSLGTREEKRSFVTMSKSCIRSVYDKKLKECTNIFCTIKIIFIKNWLITKLSCYQFYLWFKDILPKKTYI